MDKKWNGASKIELWKANKIQQWKPNIGPVCIWLNLAARDSNGPAKKPAKV